MFVAIFLVLGVGPLLAVAAEPVVGPEPQDVEEMYVPEPSGLRAVPWVEGLLYFATGNRSGRGRSRPGDDKIYRLEPLP
jgi:hypothetical protein